MALPYPQITFRVKTYDPIELSGQLLPDSRENIISQLESATVWILNWPYPLKHGDTFTLYGREAIETQKNYSQLGTENAYLETVYYGIPLIPTPTPTASPAPSPTPSPTPSATPTPTPSPTGTPAPTATPAPT